jgi:Calcineurin-like phosphoesterase
MSCLALAVGLTVSAVSPGVAAAASSSFGAAADARVYEASPATNYGSSSTLRVDLASGARVESVLRFSVAGTSGAVRGARLRLYATTGTVDGPAVHATSSAWSESAVTWANRPSPTSDAVADLGAFASAAWVELDVTSLVTGDGTYSFLVVPTSSDGADFYSRQSGNAALRPQLVVETGDSGAPVAALRPTLIGTAREGETLTVNAGTWLGSAPIAYAYRWERCAPSGLGCSVVAGAGAPGYALEAADVGSTVRAVVTATNAAGPTSEASAPSAVVLAAGSGDPVIAAAGDIAGCAHDEDEATAAIVDVLQPTRVLTLGDTVYETGTAEEFANCYDPTWGRHRAITSPIVGNHEYETLAASPYYNYFGPAAGDPSRGYYAFDLGTWRLYALNSNCEFVPCGVSSAQEQWLRADLVANPRSCILAYAHHPRFASGRSESRRDNTSIAALHRAFLEASGDVWLGAHNHTYERLTRLNASGEIDLAGGARHFVVGTGGRALDPFGLPIMGSEVRDNLTHGVLALTLRPAGYTWEFVPQAGRSFTDSGADTCGAAPPDDSAPAAPASLTATAAGESEIDLNWGPATDDMGVVAYEIQRNGILLTTTTTTTFADTAVAAGQTYSYVVRARDAAGNMSAPSNTATAAPQAPTTVTLQAIADARVHEASPSTNYGSSSTLRVDVAAGARVDSLLRFSVPALSGPITSARLLLYATTGTVDGPAVHATSNTWSEMVVTWATRPLPTGTAAADAGAFPSASWVEFDVTSLVAGDGTVDFSVVGMSSDGADFHSRQSGKTTLRPQLVIETG